MDIRTKSNTENPAGSPKISRKAAGSEFGAFRELTRKLVRVPKRNLDQKRK